MNIYIGNLPGRRYEIEILNLITNFNKKVQSNIALPVTRNINDQFFCIASINHEKTARKFIKKLHMKSPYGNPLHIRELIHRAYNNERRNIMWRKIKWKGIEKRLGERRVLHLRDQNR